MAQSFDFDFQNFAVNAIKTIDEIRSIGRNGSKQIESRINAFYRAIGLPSVVDIESTLDKKNTGNVSNILPLDISNPDTLETFGVALSDREGAFNIRVAKEEYESLLYFKQKKASNNLSDRTRGNMIPAVVNGNIEIFPQANRVATAFTSEDELDIGDGRTKYKRPLIESIIYIRLKSFGAINDSVRQAIENDFASSFGLSGRIPIDINGLNGEIAKTLRNTILSSVDSLEEAIVAANNATKDQGKIYKLPAGNIAEQNPIDSGERIVDGTLDIQNSFLKSKESSKQIFLTLLSFSDESGSDKKNAVENVMLSNLISVLSADDIKTTKDIKDNDRKIRKNSEEIKNILRKLDLFTGDFSGISGLDVLIVIDSLFEIDMKYLLGLLNDDASTNLSKLKREARDAIKNKADLFDSLDALQNKMTELYAFVDKELMQGKVRNKQSKQQDT